MAHEQERTLGDGYLFVNVGTGTSIHYVIDGRQERVGGSGIGGGTLLGLAYLLTGMRDYDTIVQTAGDGDRGQVDLKVRDIFEGALPPISGDLTASNFGKTEMMPGRTPANADILASLIGLIGEVVVTVSTNMAAHNNADAIVYIGSSLRSNPLLQETIETYTKLAGKTPIFLDNGAYSGAVGALLSLDENRESAFEEQLSLERMQLRKDNAV